MQRGKGRGRRGGWVCTPSIPSTPQGLRLLCSWTAHGPCTGSCKKVGGKQGKLEEFTARIPLVWDREIVLFRTCHLFLTQALRFMRCCYQLYKRKAERFLCCKASVSHWAQDGLGRFLIPGMQLFIDPNPGNKITWPTSPLRNTPCSPGTLGKE